MLQVYCGRGKGKTSAAVGAAMRAAGQGLRVLVVQFMKDRDADSGEVTALAGLDLPITLLRAPLPYSIVRPPTRAALRTLQANTRELLHAALRHVHDRKPGLVVFDELGIALHRKWLDGSEVRRLLDEVPPGTEVIVTGRHMPRWLLERADYVTRMIKVRHPYDLGVKARKGIEY